MTESSCPRCRAIRNLLDCDTPGGKRTQCPVCQSYVDYLALGRMRFKMRESEVCLDHPCKHPWHRRKLVKALLATDFTIGVPPHHPPAKEPTK